MTVSYRPSMTDNWHQFGHFLTQTILGRCLLAFFLVIPFVVPAAFYHSVVLHHTPPLRYAAPGPRFYHLMVITSIAMVAATYVILLFCGLLSLCLGAFIFPKTTINVNSDILTLRVSTPEKLHWKQFSAVAEEPDYFYFIGWMHAIFVPKRAFNNSAEAYAFFDLASDYWRKAKGIAPPPTPDVAGVWPPAPRAGDSQELGGTPKG